MLTNTRPPAKSYLFATWIVLSATACGGGGSGPTAPMAAIVNVEFIYQASTTIDPAVTQQFPDCVAAVGQTHIHPGWRDFSRVNMVAADADTWQRSFTDVPVGSEQRIRISDPNTCTSDPNGASTTNVFANGVRLTRVVDTPGNGTEPGLAFSVTAGGVVSP